MSKFGEKVKKMLRNWLQIQPPPAGQSITLHELLSFETRVTQNRIWYRGDAHELSQFYKQIPDGCERFWRAAPDHQKIRKIHSGLPAMMVDTLAYVVMADLDDISFGDGAEADVTLERWSALEKDADFRQQVSNALVLALSLGDGAFKISVDPSVSKYPLLQFYPMDRVDFDTRWGRITGITFYDDYPVKSKIYRLAESHTEGNVRYTLYDGDNPVELSTVPELTELKPAEFDGGHMMAVPLIIYQSQRYPGRGKSVYEGKLDSFDALDEVISQWLDAVRAGRVKKYIPADFIPRDPATLQLKQPNDFGSTYIDIDVPPSESNNPNRRIDVVQPEIRYEAYLSTYTTALDMCLQGILSPATLGIDIGKMSSAEAQREKKDITGHTRNTITAVLEKVLPQLIASMLMTYDTMQGNPPGHYEPIVSFGEYGAPDFGARVETVSKMAVSGTASIEAQVDELWGNSKDDSWKADEVRRIKQEKGIMEAEEPSAGDELP